MSTTNKQKVIAISPYAKEFISKLRFEFKGLSKSYLKTPQSATEKETVEGMVRFVERYRSVEEHRDVFAEVMGEVLAERFTTIRNSKVSVLEDELEKLRAENARLKGEKK